MLYAYAFIKKIIKKGENVRKKLTRIEMNIYFYIIIFIIGALFGSFYTLAVYRIPRKIDIVYTHSFCPNCGHKLRFFELIPVLSYIFLGGKCKKCKQPIRPRYFILEILSGLTFVLLAISLNLNVYNLDINTIIKFCLIVLYFVAIFLIAGIDKEERKIEKGVLYYSFAVSSAYIIYLCIIGQTSIYRYVMYLVALIILLIVDSEKQIKEAKQSYLFQILMLIVVMLINTGEFVTLFSVVIPLIAVFSVKLFYCLKNALNKSFKIHKNMMEIYKFGYLFCLSNVIIFICKLYFTNY